MTTDNFRVLKTGTCFPLDRASPTCAHTACSSLAGRTETDWPTSSGTIEALQESRPSDLTTPYPSCHIIREPACAAFECSGHCAIWNTTCSPMAFRSLFMSSSLWRELCEESDAILRISGLPSGRSRQPSPFRSTYP